MSEKVKTLKSKDQIDNLIMEMDAEPAKVDYVPVEIPGSRLVPDEYYRGTLFPMIQNYLPEGTELTDVEKVELTKGVQRKITGLSASVPIKCYGDSCPFRHQCPLFLMEKAPFGMPCPIESMVMDLYTKRYLDEFTVEAEDFSEVTTMSMLAATHIMEMRGFIAIGQDESPEGNLLGAPDGLIRNVVGFNNDDEPIVQIQEHPGYNIIERAWKWRTKLLESLGATRRERLKLHPEGEVVTGSLASNMAKLKSTIEKITIADVEV